MHSSATGPSTDELTDVTCHACSVYDASSRHSTHPEVVSMVVSCRDALPH